MRKIESNFIASSESGARLPCTEVHATLPRRATSMTAPGINPSSIFRLVTASRRFSCADDSPTSSGFEAMGRMPFSACAAVAKDRASKMAISFCMALAPGSALTIDAASPLYMPFQQRPFALEELDHRIHDSAHARQRAQVAMDQQPLVSEDLGDHAAHPLQGRVGIAEIAGQH